MLKKLTALLLGLVLLGTLAVAQTADYTGTWYLTSVEASGVVMVPSEIGMEMVMILEADGTGLITISGQGDEIATWTLDGETLTITADNEPLDFTMDENGQLVADTGGSIMTFGHEPPASAPVFVPAEEIAAEDISAFDGTWNAVTVGAEGVFLPFEMMAQAGLTDGTIVVDNGSVMALGTTVAQTGTLEDGKLVIPAPEGADEAFTQVYSLLEDGTLTMAYMDIVFYCELAEIVE